MLFSTAVFLFFFLPLSLLAFYIAPIRFRNAVLLAFSLVFYAWGGVTFSLILIFSLVSNYLSGRWIDASLNREKLALGVGVGLNLSILIVFKYANFFVENVNVFLDSFQVPVIPSPGIVLPIGISFFTFQAISYLVDIYRKEAAVQKNFINLALYISLFPQLIAGPIVRYHDIANQLLNRTFSSEKFRSGIERFVLGLAKKVLIANSFAYVADQVFSTPFNDLTTSAAWLGIISYAIQIYFDFAGYSDMAIGLGRMFGFEFMENFNYPYMAKSVKDFWRRWHISLSSWFRDYLYIPLGGNRKGEGRTYLNLMLVFFLTGFWHGASWSFVVWGLFHGLFLVIERLGFEKILMKAGFIPRHIYTLLVVLIGWVFFRVEEIGDAIHFIQIMFGFTEGRMYGYSWIHFVNSQIYYLFAVAILGSAGLFPYLYKKWTQGIGSKSIGLTIELVCSYIFYVSIFALSILYVLSDSYNPFIYFRF